MISAPSKPTSGVTGMPGMQSGHGELAAVIASYNEISERLKRSHERLVREVGRLRQELADKNRELARKERLASLGEMAAGVAHEVRNPLGGIQLYASMLEGDLAGQPQQQRLAERISEGVRSLDRIVSEILCFAGGGAQVFVRVSAGDVIRQVIESAAACSDSAGVELQIDSCDAQAFVHANASQLQRALLNLTLNAIDAAGAGGHVRLACEAVEADGMVRFMVTDDGPGIAAPQAQRIFDPFFTTKATGTGLGLAIVHQIVESHGGTIGVERRTAGGMKFTLHIPAAAESPINKAAAVESPLKAAVAASIGRAAGRQLRVGIENDKATVLHKGVA